MYSQLQNLNPRKGSPEWLRQMAEAQVMVRFAMRAAEEQMRLGGYFIYEHPQAATS